MVPPCRKTRFDGVHRNAPTKYIACRHAAACHNEDCEYVHPCDIVCAHGNECRDRDTARGCPFVHPNRGHANFCQHELVDFCENKACKLYHPRIDRTTGQTVFGDFDESLEQFIPIFSEAKLWLNAMLVVAVDYPRPRIWNSFTESIQDTVRQHFRRHPRREGMPDYMLPRDQVRRRL